ncbi:MAG: flippase-like domain-containing protein [Candidatus Hydrogenedentota bacterium]|nr:MAG: flippase-like domain-containing protein [Candidatus Hydrogenedentota bacterium]
MDSGQHIISRPKIIRGIKIFAVLTLIGLFLIIYRASFAESIKLLKEFSFLHLALIVLLLAFDWIVSGARILVFAAKVHPEISLLGCIRASLANVFLGGVTPSQTGGGAGQIYILHKEGMGGIDATVVSFLGFFNSVIFLSAAGIIINVFFKPDFNSLTLRYFSTTTIVLFSLISAAVILALIDPSLFESVIRSFLGIVPALKKWLARSATMKKFFEAVRRYHMLMHGFLKRGKLVLAAGFLLTAVIYFTKFVMAYLVIGGLGIDVNFWQVIYLQLILILVFYFSPTPGASGVAEVSTAYIMGHVIPGSHTGIFVLLWRFFTLFLGMIAGAYILMRILLKSDRRAAGGKVS